MLPCGKMVLYSALNNYVDEKEYAHNFTQAATWAVNLAVEATYLTSETAELLQLSVKQSSWGEYVIVNKDTSDEIIARSERQALSLKREANL